MKAVRMLVVSSDTYPPSRVDVTELFGVELAARGHKIDWILQSEAANPRGYVTNWSNGKVWVGATDLGDSLFHRLRKHWLAILNDLRLIGVMRRGVYDLVEVKDKFVAGIAASLMCRWRKIPFVYWLSYPFPEHYLLRAADGTARYPFLYRIRGTLFAWVLYRWLLRAADHVFVQSEKMRDDLALQGVPRERMSSVPMGVGEELLRTLPRAQAKTVLPTDALCIVYLGTLVRIRNIDFLIRVLARVRREVPNAMLYLVGRGDHASDERFLKAEAAKLGLDSGVVFVGQLPRAEALRYVAEADVCVSPFYPTPVLASASPTKLVEYMALGKPVVANDHPEQRLVIEESGAGFCVAWNEAAFAEAIVKVLRNPAAAAAMGERGRTYVIERRSYDVISTHVERRLVELAHGACVHETCGTRA